MRRTHPTALCIEQDPGQQAWLIAGRSIGSIDAVLGEEIAKVLDRIENAQPLEFDFNPFGPYYVGQRPFIGILLLALVAAS